MKTIVLFLTLIAATFTTVAQDTADEPDVKYVYSLPYATGHTATVRRLSAVETRRGHHLNMLNFTSWEFAFKGGATAAVAARAGEVIVVDDYMAAVRHDDGTIARYRMIEGIEVEKGAFVAQGDIIGKSTQVAYNVWVIGFELYYPIENTDTDPERSITARYPILERYIDPVFRTNLGKTHLTEGKQYRAIKKNWFVFWK